MLSRGNTFFFKFYFVLFHFSQEDGKPCNKFPRDVVKSSLGSILGSIQNLTGKVSKQPNLRCPFSEQGFGPGDFNNLLPTSFYYLD